MRILSSCHFSVFKGKVTTKLPESSFSLAILCFLFRFLVFAKFLYELIDVYNFHFWEWDLFQDIKMVVI